ESWIAHWKARVCRASFVGGKYHGRVPWSVAGSRCRSRSPRWPRTPPRRRRRRAVRPPLLRARCRAPRAERRRRPVALRYGERMSDPAPRPGGGLTRRQREQRAYRLVLATGAGALATVVTLALAIFGV